MKSQKPEITISPLNPLFGAEVRGLNLSEAGNADNFSIIRELFERHSALLFRNQNLSEAEQILLAKQFGPDRR